MKTSLLPLFALTAALMVPTALEAKIVRTVEKTFTVRPGGKLTASTEGGDIVVHTADVAEVRIVARQNIRTNDEAEADRLLAGLELKFEQSGDDVRVESKYEKSGRGFWRRNWPPVSVDLEMTVPRDYHFNGATSGGNVSVESIRGNVVAKTSGGNLRFDRVEGDLEGRTSGGDITLKEGTARAKLSTSGGNIKVDRAGGPTDVSTSGGNIRINDVAELIRAETSGGNIFANITGWLRDDAVLGTSGGDVTVRVDKAAAYTLDARTSGGDVDVNGITITVDGGGIGRSRLAGAVNGGGPTLRLRSSGGNITLRGE